MSTSPLLAYSLQQGSVKSLQYKLLSHSSLWLELHTRSHSSLRDLFYQSSTPVLGWCWGHTSNLARNQLQTLRSQAILPGPCWTLSLMAYNICSLANSLLKALEALLIWTVYFIFCSWNLHLFILVSFLCVLIDTWMIMVTMTSL